ncbi:hypothetical protein GL218_09274 [Daldinia childiae]|uniref:uncharacterized protein n=1 Tax=Daldinia childiae TaxID=326645 RepID=UPI0014468AE6|nr:uncharacterized protein GL218_09274 [Daldinia childiae]KAF3065909.1 hypothetical protein GL218_09274 [Daldinia childiae]
MVRVHIDDMLCLSVENCSFNLPFEEIPVTNSDTYGGGSSDDDEEELGWAYDPQLTPPLPSTIRRSRVCVEMASGDRIAIQSVNEALRDLLSFSQNRNAQPGEMLDQVPLVMFDALNQQLGQRQVEELTPSDEAFWDRYGDRYVILPCSSTGILRADYKLVKVRPETNDIRLRYLRSAILQSPKRLVNRPS